MSDTRPKDPKTRENPPRSQKPGERTPPKAAIAAQPEAVKTPGIGGVPSPVGDNDLA